MLSPRRSGLSVAPAQGDGDPYSRALQDSEFLEHIRSTYVGGHDALDALWWLSHPNDSGPSGAPPPSARLHALQHRLFSANGDSLGSDRINRELHELKAEIAAERQSIQQAITVAVDRCARGPVPTLTRNGVETDETPVVDHPDVPLAEGLAHRSRRYARLLTALGMVAALACGVVIANVANAANSEEATPSAAPAEALLVFDDPQVPEDLPTQPMPPTFIRESFRELVPARFSRTDGPIYAVRGFSDLVCLVAVTSDRGHVSTCANEEQFAAAGLLVSWSIDGGELDLDLPVSRRQAKLALWMPDGEVRSAGPRE
jgi:hypothetical protein